MIDGGKLYKDLGINPTATADEIRAAYRAKSKQHHPDKGGDIDTFKSIAAAYEVLSDEQKRIAYDAGRDPNGGSVEDRAKENVANAFSTLINGDLDPHGTDFIAVIIEDVNKNIAKVEALNRSAKKQLHRLGIMTERLTGEGMLFDVIATQKRMVENQMGTNADTMAMLKAMLVILDDWKYSHSSPLAYFNASTTTGGINIMGGWKA